MPGAFHLLNETDPTSITEAPETVKIWLPSQLPSNSREKWCAPDLLYLEFRFCVAQAHNTLDLIRCLYGVYQVLLMKNQVHMSTSQGTMTKTKTLFRSFTSKIDQAAAQYCEAQTALLRLDPSGFISPWKESLKELRWNDICGPSGEEDEPSQSL